MVEGFTGRAREHDNKGQTHALFVILRSCCLHFVVFMQGMKNEAPTASSLQCSMIGTPSGLISSRRTASINNIFYVIVVVYYPHRGRVQNHRGAFGDTYLFIHCTHLRFHIAC